MKQLNKNTFRFDELFEIDELQKMQDAFSELTGVASLITLVDGTPITKPSNFCTLCDIIRKTDKGLINCMKSDTHLSQMSLNSTNGHIQPCLSAGLWDGGVSIVVDGIHVGNWMIGQVKNDEQNLNNVLEYAETIGANKKEIADAYEKVTVMSSEKFKTAIQFLDSFVKELAQKASYKLKFSANSSQHKEMGDMQKSSETKFRSYIEFSPHAVIISDIDGQFLEVNKAGTRITGYSNDELLAIDRNKLFDGNGKYERHFSKTKNYGLASDELELKTKYGELKYVLVDTLKMPDEKYIGFVSDISYLKKIENSLIQKRQQLEEAEKIAQIGYASINFAKGIWESSSTLDNMIGIDDHFDKKIGNWINIIHPEMIPTLKDYFLNEVIPQQLTIETEVKIIRPNDGEIRWLHVVGKPEFDASGWIQTLLFTLQDITERKEWTDILYKNEALYRSILNTSPDVIAVVDLEAKILMISPIAAQMYGSENTDQIIGRSIFEFIASKDHARIMKNFELMFESYLGTIEYKMVRTDGKILQTEVNGDVIRNSKGEPTGLIFVIRDISQRKQTEEKLAKSKEQLKEFAGHLQSIREEEKIALAREIHDDLGQILVAMKIEIGMLKKKLANTTNQLSNAFVDEEMTKMLDLTNKTIDIARRIMSDLRSENVNHLGFVEAAKMYIENFYERFKIECQFENNIDEIEFTQKQTVALYRILQESLSNIVKHANASQVKVTLNKTHSNLSLCIIDNGCGFDINIPRKTNSYGLVGMKERVALLDGNINIRSEVGEGTSICIELPDIYN
jgi:PAS domain S-box-containing protein